MLCWKPVPIIVFIKFYSFIADDFKLKEYSACARSNIYDNFNHLSLAKNACNQDPQCIGVYDRKGDNTGPFQLCRHGFITPDVTVSSCIYKKRSYIGWYLFFICSVHTQYVIYIVVNNLLFYMVTEYWDATSADWRVCVDIKLLTTSSSYTWELGHCFAPHHYIGKGLYTDKCCLRAFDEYTLKCKTSQSSGWANSYLLIEKHRFCDDTVGYKSMSKINILGTWQRGYNICYNICYNF